MTLYNRANRWTVFSPAGSGDMLGGSTTWSSLANKFPLTATLHSVVACIWLLEVRMCCEL